MQTIDFFGPSLTVMRYSRQNANSCDAILLCGFDAEGSIGSRASHPHRTMLQTLAFSAVVSHAQLYQQGMTGLAPASRNPSVSHFPKIASPVGAKSVDPLSPADNRRSLVSRLAAGIPRKQS